LLNGVRRGKNTGDRHTPAAKSCGDGGGFGLKLGKASFDRHIPDDDRKA